MTAEPDQTTSPAPSWPRQWELSTLRGPMRPVCQKWTSEPHIPLQRIRTTQSVGRGFKGGESPMKISCFSFVKSAGLGPDGVNVVLSFIEVRPFV